MGLLIVCCSSTRTSVRCHVIAALETGVQLHLGGSQRMCTRTTSVDHRYADIPVSNIVLSDFSYWYGKGWFSYCECLNARTGNFPYDSLLCMLYKCLFSACCHSSSRLFYANHQRPIIQFHDIDLAMTFFPLPGTNTCFGNYCGYSSPAPRTCDGNGCGYYLASR